MATSFFVLAWITSLMKKGNHEEEEEEEEEEENGRICSESMSTMAQRFSCFVRCRKSKAKACSNPSSISISISLYKTWALTLSKRWLFLYAHFMILSPSSTVALFYLTLFIAFPSQESLITSFLSSTDSPLSPSLFALLL